MNLILTRIPEIENSRYALPCSSIFFRFLTLADFTAYVTAQDLVSETYTDQAKWARMAIMNIARFKCVFKEKIDMKLLPLSLL